MSYFNVKIATIAHLTKWNIARLAKRANVIIAWLDSEEVKSLGQTRASTVIQKACVILVLAQIKENSLI